MMAKGKVFRLEIVPGVFEGAFATGASLKYKVGWLTGFLLREKMTSVACLLGSGLKAIFPLKMPSCLQWTGLDSNPHWIY